ncbi:type II secretion system protein GspM [Roseateles sp. DB2]|uniref:type II secretion system protein GspM n=1 Tax=Roseateles sp. DB2 TaxID=3453717 RepID=UPI003EEA191F
MDAPTRRPLPPQLQLLQQRWQALQPRERSALLLAGIALAALLLWLMALQPALRTLRETPPRLAQAEEQLQQMRRLAQESQALKDLPPVPPAQAEQALKASTERLGGSAQLQVSGDRATLQLRNISPEQLQNWLAEARSAARARTVEAQMQRSPSGYNGVIVLALDGGAAP